MHAPVCTTCQYLGPETEGCRQGWGPPRGQGRAQGAGEEGVAETGRRIDVCKGGLARPEEERPQGRDRGTAIVPETVKAICV